MLPGAEYLDVPNYHKDYLNRWKTPGDELFTNVPAAGEFNRYLGQVYSFSETLISKGDHIRLQDINISYTLPESKVKHLNIQRIRISLYASNLGIIWRANKNGLDPDYPNASYPNQRSIALGVQMDF